MTDVLSTLRQRWLALAAVVALLAVTLTAGSMFAANEPGQPEASPPAQPVEPAPERVLSQPADHESQIDLPPMTKQPPAYPNLDANLNRVVEESASSQNPASTESGSSGTSVGPILVTFYVDSEHVDDMRQYLEYNGIYVRNVGVDYIEAHVPPLLLPAASERPGVLRVDTVISPQPAQGSVISQGVGLHEATAWHRAGYRGQGVKIGIIDSGFEQFSMLQQGGELPPNVLARCYFGEPQPPSSSLSDCEVASQHGTAVAETVIDIAPDAELYIAQPISLGDLRNAVDWMAGQGVHVINYSIGLLPDGPGDGTSPFSNSSLRTVDAAVAAGITWVAAAGNDARNVWYGTFSDPDNNGNHNFEPRDEGNTFEIFEGERVIAFMRWDGDWGQEGCDLDLGLFRINPESQDWEALALDTTLQDGTRGSYPFAGIIIEEVEAAIEGQVFIAIRKANCPVEPRWIQLTVWTDDGLEHYAPGHHIGVPPESRNPGLLAVGATHFWDTNTIASYSSRGPTLDARTKPEITGVACGLVTAYTSVSLDGNPCWFPGTSQAAPHVAGLAGLVKQRAPNFSPSQVARFMMQNAQERGSPGSDNTWGHGFAALPDPSVEIELSPAPPITNLAAPANVGVEDTDNPGEVVITWDPVPGARFYRIGWVTRADVEAVTAQGHFWLEAFAFIDIVNQGLEVTSQGQNSYTISRLSPGVEYAFLVASNGSQYGEPSWPPLAGWFFLTLQDDPDPRSAIATASVDLEWESIPAARYYRIGWVTRSDVAAATSAGRHWLEAFVFVDIANRDQTTYTVGRLTPGIEYALLVAGNSSLYGEPAWPPADAWQFITPDETQPEPMPAADQIACPAPEWTVAPRPARYSKPGLICVI